MEIQQANTGSIASRQVLAFKQLACHEISLYSEHEIRTAMMLKYLNQYGIWKTQKCCVGSAFISVQLVINLVMSKHLIFCCLLHLTMLVQSGFKSHHFRLSVFFHRIFSWLKNNYKQRNCLWLVVLEACLKSQLNIRIHFLICYFL